MEGMYIVILSFLLTHNIALTSIRMASLRDRLFPIQKEEIKAPNTHKEETIAPNQYKNEDAKLEEIRAMLPPTLIKQYDSIDLSKIYDAFFCSNGLLTDVERRAICSSVLENFCPSIDDARWKIIIENQVNKLLKHETNPFIRSTIIKQTVAALRKYRTKNTPPVEVPTSSPEPSQEKPQSQEESSQILEQPSKQESEQQLQELDNADDSYNTRED